MKVVVLKDFYDIKEQVNRKQNDIIEMDKARYEDIIAVHPELLKEQTDSTKKIIVESKPKSKKFD